MFDSLDEIKAAHTGYFFVAGTMKYWDSRVSEKVYPTPEGTFFVTSELDAESETRLYTVRKATADGSIWTAGEFQEHATLGAAHRAAEKLAAS